MKTRMIEIIGSFVFVADAELLLIGIKPYIISPTEKISDGDWYTNGMHLYQADLFYEKAEKDKKVLALPEQFSPEQLRQIRIGELKEGNILIQSYQDAIALDFFNYVILHPVVEQQSLDFQVRALSAELAVARKEIERLQEVNVRLNELIVLMNSLS
jgi:hypothetical protein